MPGELAITQNEKGLAIDNLVNRVDINPCMLKWTLICAVLAVVFGLLGFTGIATDFAVIAKVLFGIFLLGVLLTLVLGATIFKAI